MRRDLGHLGEFGIIDLFRQKNPPYHEWVVRSIGDDCAVLNWGAEERLLVTTDMLTEGVHFELDKISTHELGFKCLAVNLSDIAAMGAEPKAFFLSVGICSELDESFLLEFRDGLLECAGKYRVDLLGGDTVASRHGLTLSLTVLGRAKESEVIYRSGAKPGDRIMVGGVLGDSAGGLHLLYGKGGEVSKQNRTALIQAHLAPLAQIDLGRLLAINRLASAMIDVSDGLIQDIDHICRESKVGAKVEADLLPLSEALCSLGRRAGLDPRDFGLFGGEDYVLAFCVPEDREADAKRLCEKELAIELTTIGEIVEGFEVSVKRDGAWERVESGGFDHFRRSKSAFVKPDL